MHTHTKYCYTFLAKEVLLFTRLSSQPLDLSGKGLRALGRLCRRPEELSVPSLGRVFLELAALFTRKLVPCACPLPTGKHWPPAPPAARTPASPSFLPPGCSFPVISINQHMVHCHSRPESLLGGQLCPGTGEEQDVAMSGEDGPGSGQWAGSPVMGISLEQSWKLTRCAF